MIAVLRDLLHFSWILFDNLSCGFMRSCCDADFTEAAVISLSPSFSRMPLAPASAPPSQHQPHSPCSCQCPALCPFDMPAHSFVGGKLVSLMVLNVAAVWREAIRGKGKRGKCAWLDSGGWAVRVLALSCVYVGALSASLTCVLAFWKLQQNQEKTKPRNREVFALHILHLAADL